MGGKDAGPATEVKEGLGKGKEYEVPEFFEFNKYSYFDIEKDVVDGGRRVEQPKSGQTDFWWIMTCSVAAAVLFNSSVGKENIG